MRILNSKYIKTLILLILIVIINVLVLKNTDFNIKGDLVLKYEVVANHVDTYQLFFSRGEEWSEENSSTIGYTKEDKKQEMAYTVPKDVEKIRLDVGSNPGKVEISNISINYLWKTIDLFDSVVDNSIVTNDIDGISFLNNNIVVNSKGVDPFFVIDLTSIPIKNMFAVNQYMSILFKIVICVGINILILIIIKKKDIIKNLIKELYNNRVLMWNLSRNDFKTKYAGSYLGIFWAFVQPIVTVLIYWFVFEVGFKSVPIDNFPFVLWLVAGMVPWFFFNEAIVNATNSLTEYSYLVKKVVFKISILPIVKIISALFVHLFFIGFTILIFMGYGYMPDIYLLQFFYYTICTFVLALGIGYATCAIVIFFKDLGQIVGIALQIGMWMTPIMWSYTMIPDKYQWALKINPMYYIVEGYRDSFINKVWFWERYNQTLYFWIITIGLFGIGAIIFKKLKGHFADVL